ncbi:ribosome silencing factor [Heliophilum fasciatum]|uniref:Ribosomal silencing factor RsfS n=1 Tax=Heliophilum fasciatum TaxID=35700 RepID=A0A4R2RV38_9FIRM|nr:ribosome silencing factor [Heliophilum fasciatum]MCW2277113.1 ribosome-associated protein [Heliophilum fasciatum]TCP68250.1 ribosome-associated protein [Heliophilum fasciatum]
MTDPKTVAIAIAEAASEKKAMDIMLLDLREKSNVTDYFVICSGNSVPQVQAIAQNIEDKMKESDLRVLRTEGYREGRWVLLDFGSVVVHIFRPETRDYYSLERLWGDAPRAVEPNFSEFVQ